MKSKWSQELFIKAYYYAAKAHHGQLVPGSDLPYITHISLVSMEIMASLSSENKRNGDLAIQCALLHDIIEDTSITYEQFRNEFGTEVADGVKALTKNKNLEKKDQMKDCLKRIEKQPMEVWMVKMADRITNLQPPPSHWDLKKREEYREQAKQIYNSLKDADVFLADRLKRKIEDYRIFINKKY